MKFTFSTFAGHSKICVIGGGSGALSLVPRLLRGKVLAQDVRIFEPNDLHYYQPGQTLVASGLMTRSQVVGRVERLFNKHVPIVKQAVTLIKPESNEIQTAEGLVYSYD